MSKIHIEPLTKDNYNTWAIQAEAVLVKEKLWKYVQSAPSATASAEDIEGDKQAKSKKVIAAKRIIEFTPVTTKSQRRRNYYQVQCIRSPCHRANRCFLPVIKQNQIIIINHIKNIPTP